jgi:alpha-1,3-rhamnosyl/mannosyltransferase
LNTVSAHHLPGISKSFAPANPEERVATRDKIGVTRRFLFILPCPLDGYKNGLTALQALALLDIASQSEVIVTAGEDRSSFVEQSFPNLKIRFTRFHSDVEYSRVVASSDLLLWPSLIEGLGLPPIEAVASGIQAVCILNEINLEIFGETAIYSTGTDPVEFASAIVRALRSRLDQRMISRVSQIRSYEGYANSLLNFGLFGASSP